MKRSVLSAQRKRRRCKYSWPSGWRVCSQGMPVFSSSAQVLLCKVQAKREVIPQPDPGTNCSVVTTMLCDPRKSPNISAWISLCLGLCR